MKPCQRGVRSRDHMLSTVAAWTTVLPGGGAARASGYDASHAGDGGTGGPPGLLRGSDACCGELQALRRGHCRAGLG